MQRHHTRTAVVAAGVALALAVAGAAYAAVAARSSATTTATVKVTESEYHIQLSTKSVRAGNVTFVVHNAGKLLHKLDIAGAGLRTVAVGTFNPGTTHSKTVKVTGGTLSLWCPVHGHAALGMKASLKISGATAGGGAGTTPTTTSGSTWG